MRYMTIMIHYPAGSNKITSTVVPILGCSSKKYASTSSAVQATTARICFLMCPQESLIDTTLLLVLLVLVVL